jgi:hypothetical protein
VKKVASQKDALVLLESKRVLPLGDLATAIVGRKVSGSWWGHPKGKQIYAIASALEDHADVLTCKLDHGRTTFVHRTLWAPLLRVVTNNSWREDRERGLSPGARRMLHRVVAAGALRPKKMPARDKRSLEKSCLLRVSSEHTETGAHATVLETWDSWASADLKRAAKKLDLGDAKTALASHGLLAL